MQRASGAASLLASIISPGDSGEVEDVAAAGDGQARAQIVPEGDAILDRLAARR